MRRLSSVAFFVILLLVVFPSCKKGIPFFGKKQKQADTTELWLEKQRAARVADSLKKVQEAQLAIDLARQDSIRLVEAAKQAAKYHMIVGSFYTPEYARSWAEVFRQRGYNAQILKMRDSQFELVSAEAFSNLTDAYSKLYEYQANMIEAWIYINE